MIYGYARVSSEGQARDGNSLASQRAELSQAGAEVVFEDVFTGTRLDRPMLTELLSVLAPGDTVLVTKLDRIERSARQGLELFDRLAGRGVTVRVMNMGVFDDSPAGRLMRTMLLAFAEFERDMIVQRTAEGKAAARARDPGYKEGRKRVEVDTGVMAKLVAEGRITVAEACRELGISRSTWYNRVREARKEMEA